MFQLLLLCVLLVPLAACAASNPAASRSGSEPWPSPERPVLRVGGDLAAAVTRERGTKNGEESVVWRFDRCTIDTPLPEGYPPPTPPAAIDLKLYPLVRRAEVESPSSPTAAFYPLLQHIQSRSIAMTSPVEMDYTPAPDGALRTESMSFLYRRVEQGPAGATDSNVVVRDRAATVVLSIGVRGPLGTEALARARERLRAVLAEHPEWNETGTLRTFEYNSPFVPLGDRWAEVQLPVRR